MSDGEQLLLILSLIYLSGCLAWVDRRTVLFSSWFGRRWRTVVADYIWGNSSGSFFLLNPFPPLGFMLMSRLIPISLSPKNIVAFNAQTVGNSGRPYQSGRMAPITPNTKFSRKGSALLVDGKSFCDIYDIDTAHKIVVLLNKIKGCDESIREQAISVFWKERLDVHRAKNQIRAVFVASRHVRLACLLAFTLFFVVIPLASIRFGVGLAVVLGAVTMLVSALIICSAYVSCHKRYYPTFKNGLWGDLVKMMLCPPTALRAGDLIMGKLSARLDTIPLAVLLLRSTDCKAFLKEYLADLESAEIPDDLSDDIRETCLWQNQAILNAGVTIIPGLKRFMRTVDSGTESRLKTENQTRKGSGNV